jgi:hypothetical protein
MHGDARQGGASHHCPYRAQGGEQQCLVEHHMRGVLVLAAHRMRDQRDRAHAHPLREGHDDDHHVAGGASTRERVLAEAGDTVQIDERGQRLDQRTRANQQ